MVSLSVVHSVNTSKNASYNKEIKFPLLLVDDENASGVEHKMLNNTSWLTQCIKGLTSKKFSSQNFFTINCAGNERFILNSDKHLNIGERDVQKQPPELFYKKSIIENFIKFTGKRLCRSPSFDEVISLQLYEACKFITKLRHRYFLWILGNF